MKRIVAIMILCLAMAAGLNGCPGVMCFGIDTCKLQGTWEASTTTDGVTKIMNRVVITDDNLVVTSLEGTPWTLEGKYTIDATVSPKTLDFTASKRIQGEGESQVVQVLDPPEVLLCIYQVSNNELTMQTDASGTRPAAFDETQAIKFTRVK